MSQSFFKTSTNIVNIRILEKNCYVDFYEISLFCPWIFLSIEELRKVLYIKKINKLWD